MDLKLSNVSIIFFPPNTTSKVQPLDQGIIRTFKAHYRSRLVKRVINMCTLASTPEQVTISALDAVDWIAVAWKSVTQSTILNTFTKAGFQRHDPSNAADETEEGTCEVTDDESINRLGSLLAYLNGEGLQLSATEYAMFDDEVPVFNEWEDNVETLPTTEDAEQDQEENEDEVLPEEPPSFVDALEMIRKLHLLVSVRQPELHPLVSELESKLTDSYIDSRTSKQSSITDFFSRV